MTTISTALGTLPRTTTDRKAVPMLSRLFHLFAAAGRAVPFHREYDREYAGASYAVDRDRQRALQEFDAISTYRFHG